MKQKVKCPKCHNEFEIDKEEKTKMNKKELNRLAKKGIDPVDVIQWRDYL